MNILVVGGYDAKADPEVVEALKVFSRALGEQVIEQGHNLINGCRCEFDTVIAEAAFEKIKQLPTGDAKRLVSYRMEGTKPKDAHNFGRIQRSDVENWREIFEVVPEPFEKADIVIFVCGSQDEKDEANYAPIWAAHADKPLLPVTYFGGYAVAIYKQEFKKIKEKYGARLKEDEYEILKQHLAFEEVDWKEQTHKIISLAKKIHSSDTALVIMSYSEKSKNKKSLDNLYKSFDEVCSQFDYTCKRVNETNTVGSSIIVEILQNIEESAFIIADLTELKQNVFYELGYAMGQKKDFVVVTAKKGTRVPFDVNQIPITFWDPMDFLTLETKLEEKIKVIAEKQA